MSVPSPVVLARWAELQADIRHLGVQRGLRFVAACILAPFGAANVGKASSGPVLSSWAFGFALLLLAGAEMAAILQTAMLQRARRDIEKDHPELAPRDKPSRRARLLEFVSGPALSTSLYALLGAAVVVANALH